MEWLVCFGVFYIFLGIVLEVLGKMGKFVFFVLKSNFLLLN